jgi:hypothetical protein
MTVCILLLGEQLKTELKKNAANGMINHQEAIRFTQRFLRQLKKTIQFKGRTKQQDEKLTEIP